MAYIKYAGEEAVGRIAEYVNKKLAFASTMPSSPETNTIVLYVGADTSAYKQGGIYQYDGTDWNLINLVKTIELTQAEYDALPSMVKLNGTIYFVTDGSADGSVISGYYNETDGEFYVESTYETQYSHHHNTIYINLSSDTTYIYDFENEEYVQVGGSGSGTVIKYVNTLPVTGIEDIIYGIKGYNSFEETIADGFLDENVLFEKEDDLSGGYIYTPAEDVVLDASDDGVTYKGFTSLTYDGTSDWTLTFDDATNATLADGDTFYFRQSVDKFFAGDATNQKVIPFGSAGGSEISYTAGDGIEIENYEISVTEDRPATFVGTTQEWDALTATEKAQYKIVNLTNDVVGGEMVVVDTVTDGNLNPVTSNAVAEAISDIRNHFLVVSYTWPAVTINKNSASTFFWRDATPNKTVPSNAIKIGIYGYSPDGSVKFLTRYIGSETIQVTNLDTTTDTSCILHVHVTYYVP